MADSPEPFATSGPQPDDIGVVSAVFTEANDRLTLTVDQTMPLAAALNTGNWNIVVSGLVRTPTSVTTNGLSVVVQTAVGAASLLSNRWSYKPPPFDVLSLTGTWLPYQLNQPLTVV